ncbi:nucleoside-diphosphate-sugar epimerase [Salinibacter ruber]|uniref:SDR family oxidoreductase n=1 Tax=Salinibacter ruber TaxID=146919 RepID=UPI002167415F|nr:SDR family oxidoreductase [Salinibacter ruber]MCS4161430.1 nucleoside-diphosphate-sugar epimerase [Salinibacter ruber]
MMKSLVTGAAGFIGSNLVRHLLDHGHTVIGIDNLSTGRKENLEGVADEITFVEGDIRSRELATELCTDVDYVFHQAALPSVPRSIKNPWAANAHNVTGTLSVFLSARDAGVERVVFAASSSVYGDTAELPKVETMCSRPESPYAVGKHVGELYGNVFSDVYEIEIVGLRYFNVFGPRQDPSSDYAAVIPKFIDLFFRGEPPLIHGDGEQTRDFTYVENVVQANRKAALASSDDVSGEIFNVGCGERITVNRLARELKSLTGANVDPVHGDPRPGDVRHSQADISKAERAFRYEPTVDLKDGLRRTVAWFEQERELARSSS